MQNDDDTRPASAAPRKLVPPGDSDHDRATALGRQLAELFTPDEALPPQFGDRMEKLRQRLG